MIENFEKKQLKDYVHQGQKMTPFGIGLSFQFCSLSHADNKFKTKTCDGNQFCKISEVESLPHQCILL